MTAGPWWSKAHQGLEMLMAAPGPEGECRYWVSHRVTNGIHDIVTLPNWSGRAMRAAKAMLEVSKPGDDGADLPSSIVLQVSCALEAFINAVIHFIRESEQDWKDIHLPLYCLSGEDIDKFKVSTYDQWTQVGEALFGLGWAHGNAIYDFNLLMKLRSYLMHYKGEHEEHIFAAGETHEMVGQFGNRIKMRPGPSPWIDRVLTHGLAEWAVRVGETMIALFRTAWVKQRLEYLVISPH